MVTNGNIRNLDEHLNPGSCFFFFPTDKTYCLSLYYHMYGSNIKSLIISTQNGTDAPVNHWTMTGNQGNAWYRLSGLNLQLDHNTKVICQHLFTSPFYIHLQAPTENITTLILLFVYKYDPLPPLKKNK